MLWCGGHSPESGGTQTVAPISEVPTLRRVWELWSRAQTYWCLYAWQFRVIIGVLLHIAKETQTVSESSGKVSYSSKAGVWESRFHFIGTDHFNLTGSTLAEALQVSVIVTLNRSFDTTNGVKVL